MKDWMPGATVTAPTVCYKPHEPIREDRILVGGLFMNRLRRERQFVVYFHFVDWRALAFGVSFHFSGPHIEMHLPFGFVRCGFVWRDEAYYPLGFGYKPRDWGWSERYH